MSSTSDRELRPTRIPRGPKKPPSLTAAHKIARNGRTFTMIEEEEKVLKQELREKEKKIKEHEKRQEVNMKFSKKLKKKLLTVQEK